MATETNETNTLKVSNRSVRAVNFLDFQIRAQKRTVTTRPTVTPDSMIRIKFINIRQTYGLILKS